MVALNFNAMQVAPNTALEPLPSGTYDVIITDTSEKPTSTGGKMLVVEYTVQGGEHNGRKLVDRLNIVNANAKAVEIAFGTLSAICHCTNRLQVQDSAQLHGGRLKAVVAKVPRDDKPDQYTNDVKGYKDVNGNDPGKGGTGGAPQHAQQSGQGTPAQGASPSWATQGAPVPQQAPQQAYQQAPQQYAPQQQPQQGGQQQPQQGGQPGWAQQAPQQPPQQPAQAPQQPNGQPSWAQAPQPAPVQQQAPQQAQQPAPQQAYQQAPQQYAPQPGANPPWGQTGVQG